MCVICPVRLPNLRSSPQFDNQLITELNIQDYRKQIALVSQEPTLYAGSVRFNILLGAIKPAEEVTQEEIEEACRNANILEFIQSLPEYVCAAAIHGGLSILILQWLQYRGWGQRLAAFWRTEAYGASYFYHDGR